LAQEHVQIGQGDCVVCAMSRPFSGKEAVRNSLGQYTCLTKAVFIQEWGADCFDIGPMRDKTRWVLTGRNFCLETLLGPAGPEDGLMLRALLKDYVEILLISKNQLTCIQCLDKKRRDGTDEFKSLRILNASRNQLTSVTLTLGNLSELNLGHNFMEDLPDCTKLPNLQKLIVCFNRIDGALTGLRESKKLTYLDISENYYSWKPTVFEKQIGILHDIQVEELKIWPNPFGKNFPEYQFLAVTKIETLQTLDGFKIATELRGDMRRMKEELDAKRLVDYSIFDIKVQERAGLVVQANEAEGKFVDAARIPTLHSLLELLVKPLDNPDKLIKHIYRFEEEVGFVWLSRYSDRVERLAMKDSASAQVSEFSDKLQQLILRFDSVQDALVKCLVRLCASGNQALSCRCALLLAEWVDALPLHLKVNLQNMATALFRELTIRMLAGMQSFPESPSALFKASYEHGTDLDKLGDMNDIAECAEILRALASFGAPGYVKKESPSRALVLRALLPALCRRTRDELGEDQPRDGEQVYVDFDAFPGAKKLDDFQMPMENPKDICFQRCAKQSLGGFVVQEMASKPGILQIHYLQEASDALRGMRVPCPGKTLYLARATREDRKTQDNRIQKCMAWQVWRSGLEVLVVATADNVNAARCIRQYGIHKALILHEKHSFTETWLLVAQEARDTYVSLLRLAVNLMNACGRAAQEARNHFTQNKLHIHCWERVRKRLWRDGAAIPLALLKQEKPAATTMLSCLVSVLLEMSKGKRGDDVVKDLSSGMDEILNIMLEIVADTAAPDPLLFAVALDTIWMFLYSEVTRANIIARVSTRLHEFAILLPYIQGPKMGELNNMKYQELWRHCDGKYCDSVHGPTIHVHDGEWHKKVPDLRNLQHPLMFRVILGILKLIELFSDPNQNDPKGYFQAISEKLDQAHREELLIGPSSSVVLCPDYDVKIEALKCIQHVLEGDPSQLQSQEMGWILRYLQSSGIGIGKQEVFLMEVLKLTTLLIKDTGPTGFQFRRQFAKAAIRQSFDMLYVNCRRDVKGSPESEAMKQQLSMGILKVLGICSKPLSGGLRPFLRRVDFLKIVVEVIEFQDELTVGSIREELLRTWTGRDVREILEPLVTGHRLRVHGVGRLQALIRLSDVLLGKCDFDENNEPIPSTDEGTMWTGLNEIRAVVRKHEDLEMNDWHLQQSEFMDCDGISGVIELCERFYSESDDLRWRIQQAKALVKELSGAVENRIRTWWDDATGQLHRVQRTKQQIETELAKTESPIISRLMARISAVNDRVIQYFECNLKLYDEKSGNSHEKLALVFEESFVGYHKIFVKSARALDWTSLQTLQHMENEYTCGGKLMKLSEIREKELTFEKVRQVEGDLEKLLLQARAAHMELKTQLLSRGKDPPENSLKWAEASWEENSHPDDIVDCVQDGLVDFLASHGAVVTDPGLMSLSKLQLLGKIKYEYDYKRARSISSLFVEFDNATQLLRCIGDIRVNTRMSVLTIRNYFRFPRGLGQRSIVVLVQVVAMKVSHICRLELCINPGQSPSTSRHTKEAELRANLSRVLQLACQVPNERVHLISDFLFLALNSRSLRSGDIVYISQDQKKLSLAKEDVIMKQDDKLTQSHLFHIEREAGPGSVKIGDVVMLKNFLSQCYVDVSYTNHGARCRYSDLGAEQSNFKFVIEKAPPEESTSGVVGLSGFAGDADPNVIAESKGKARAHEAKFNIHSSDRVMLKVKGIPSPARRLTTKQPATWHSEFQRMKVEPCLTDLLAKPQVFTLSREGALIHFINAADLKQAEHDAPDTLACTTNEQNQKKMLRAAYMVSSLPSQPPRDGGIFRREPPTFDMVAYKQVGVDTDHADVEEDDDEEDVDDDDEKDAARSFLKVPNLVPKESQAAQMAGAMLHCIYSLVEVPSTKLVKTKVVEQLLGDSEEALPKLHRLLSIMRAVMYDDRGKTTADSIINGWVCAKMIRTVSALLGSTPMLSKSLGPRRSPVLDTAGVDMREARGDYDRERLAFLGMLSSFVDHVLVEPLLQRLAVVGQKPLHTSEISLLRELASQTESIARVYFSNELRCTPEKPDPVDSGGQAKVGKLADGVGNLADGVGDDITTVNVVELAGDSGGAVARRGHVQQQQTEKALRGEVEARIFSSLVSPGLLRVLVHAMIYGMRRESTAYHDHQHISDMAAGSSVKLVSSLVQHCAHALAMSMFGCEGCKDTSCDYNICEALSQAMSAGPKAVSRARITQLMDEWRTEKLRASAQQFLGETLTTTDSTGVQPMDTERVVFISYVWAGFLHRVLPTELTRQIYVLTSRMNLLVLEVLIESKDAMVPLASQLQLVSYRQLAKLERLVVCPRVRQFLGLCWDESTVGKHREVLVFESISRRNAFRRTLQVCLKANISGPTINNVYRCGVPEVGLRREVLFFLRQACKKDLRSEAHLVNVTFIKPNALKRSLEPLELLVLTRDHVCVLPLYEFLLEYAKFIDSSPQQTNRVGLAKEFARETQMQATDMERREAEENRKREEIARLKLDDTAGDIDDSDSDIDELPPLQQHLDLGGEIRKSAVLRGPWQKSKLKGVWFLAESEPKMRLQFESRPEEFSFFTDGERQRFKAHLALVLATPDETAADDSMVNWSVVPTGRATLKDVQKELKERDAQDNRRKEALAKFEAFPAIGA